MNRPSRPDVQYGDFQTPIQLALDCFRLATNTFGEHDRIVEPTSGEGAFLLAASADGGGRRIEGFEFQDGHVRTARQRFSGAANRDGLIRIHHQDFFSHDWASHRNAIDGSVLYIGNPPWVTNAALGVVASTNGPVKTNVDRARGMLAMTGGGNFDLSESILQTLIAAMRPGVDSMGMLVKTATVRKVAKWAWTNGFRFDHLSTHRIDAGEHFGVNVDACWMMLRLVVGKTQRRERCLSFSSLSSKQSVTAFGWYRGGLVSNQTLASKTDRFRTSAAIAWRSGVKHDATSALVLTMTDDGLKNGLNEIVDVEPDRIYRLAKGSDIANGRDRSADKFLLIPQRQVGESTEALQATLPRTMAYLNQHADHFSRRRSSIYRGRDRFAVFGVGPYTFAKWKIAVAGLYKRLTFTLVVPVSGRPVVLDDTAYALGFSTRRQAMMVHRILNESVAIDYFNARIFWDAKRPINAAVLGSLDLAAVASAVGCKDDWERCFGSSIHRSTFGQGQSGP
jgi:hypothetical protein